ncbi:hypothetical protein JCM10449v2_003444 [Rhodotorula kratochvilovae]
MASEHAHALEHVRLHRRIVKRQDRAPFADVQASLAAADDGALPAESDPAVVTTTAAAPVQTTTSAAAPPVQQSTTSAAQDAIESTSSLAPSSSATTAAPVQTTSSSAVPTTTTTTTTPSTTSQAPSTSSTTSEEPETSSSSSTTTTSESSSSLATSEVPSTTVVIVSGSLSTSTSTSSSALASASKASDNGGGSSIGTGGVIGIVAGAVVGIIAIVGVAVWFFKKKWQREDDDDQVSPFDRDEFRRASVMLDDVDEHYAHSMGSYRGGPPPPPGGHSPQMSEYSMHDVSGLGRSNTLLSNGSGGGGGGVLPGLARGNTLAAPRPPTMIGAHYTHQQQYAMPSFQPGQVVPSMPPQAYGGIDLYGATGGAGPYAAAAGLSPYGAAGLDRSLTSASAGAWRGADLSRNNSQASAYSQVSDGPHAGGAYVPAALRPGGSGHGHAGLGGGYPDERPLSLVHEDDEPYSPAHGAFPAGAPQSRSGTPTNANVQQTFFEPSGGAGAHHHAQHAREESLDAFRPRGGPAARAQQGVVGQAWSDEDVHALAQGEKRERRLSVRNGGLDAFDDDDDAGAYAGMH